MRNTLIAASLAAAACAFSQSVASPVERRVTAPGKCQQAGTGRFGTFSVSPSSNVVRNQPITIHYEQDCAKAANVYTKQLTVTIEGGGGDPLQSVASLPIPAQELGKPITLETSVPNGALPYGDGSGLIIAGTIEYTKQGVADVTYLYRFSQPFSINETAPPFSGQS